MAKEAKDWAGEVAKFTRGKAKRRTYTLSSPGVAQVTRCRVLADYPRRDLRVRTKGARMIFEKPSAVQPSR